MDDIRIEEQLRKGIALAKARKNSEARDILSQVVRNDPQSVLGWLWLAGVVETKEQRRYCLEKVLQLNPQNEVVKRVLAQIKTAQPQVTASAPYFIGHQLTSDSAGGLRRAIAHVFSPLGYEPCHIDKSTDEDIEGQSLLLRICQKTFLANFSIFDLTVKEPNDYLELGIALGLNRPVIVLTKERASLAPELGEHHVHVIVYTDPADLETKLSRLCDRGFPPTARPVPDYCYFCDRACESMSTPPDEDSYLVLNESKMLWRNIMRSLTPYLAEYHLHPVYLTDRASGPMLCDVRRKVLASQFALCHLGALSNESSFLALGMAVGSRVPWILLSKGRNSAPVDLRGFDKVEYTTLADLEERLTDTLGSFLGKVVSGPAAKSDKTTLLSLPFWIQLEDWISRVKHAAQTPEAIQGRIRIVRYDGQERLSEFVVPGKGLLVGRDPDCDVVVENQSVSARHFRLLQGRNRKCFVEDLHSKNGTFFNGTRLPPGSRVEIRPNDTIRIPGAQFLVWDDRPLPREKTAPVLTDTDQLPPILRIEIPDVSPPAYMSTWDHSLVLTVSLPDGRTRSLFEVQAYYPMRRILSKLVDLLGLPDREYSFMIENKLIGDDETPLSAGVQRNDVLVIVPKEQQVGRILSGR